MARTPAGHCRGLTGLCAIRADACGQGRRTDCGASYPAWAFPPWLTSGQHHVSAASTNHAYECACAWRAAAVQGWTARQNTAQPEADIVWDGLQGDVAVDAQGHHVTGTFQSPGLQLLGEDTKFALHDVSMRADVSTEHRHVSHSDTFVH